MTMSITELERSLRALRLSGMSATLQARALAVASHEMDFVEAFSWLVQDELDRRRSRLLERRYTLSGLPERKELKDFDWAYNPRIPRRALLAVNRGYKVHYREAHQLIEDINEARELGELRKLRAHLKSIELLVIDDLFLRRLPANAGDELADVLMSRHEKASTIIASNRTLDDWAKLLGDVVVVAPLLDRLMHHGHLLKFEGKSWRLQEAAARIAKRGSTE
jgi:DNA replication protein DnaC